MQFSKYTSSNSLVGSRDIIETEFEWYVKREFDRLGIQKAYISIIDKEKTSIYSYAYFIEPVGLDIYFQNLDYDVFLTHYLKHHLIGSLCYLQDLVDINTIRCDIFNDVIKNSIGFEHSVAAIGKITDDYHVIFSSHSDMRPSYKAMKQYQLLWHFIVNWATTRVFHDKTMDSIRQLKCHADSTVKQLTYAEIAVLNLLLRGLDGAEVARVRGVSKETVKSQLKQILHKTNSRHQNQLFAKYYLGELDANLKR